MEQFTVCGLDPTAVEWIASATPEDVGLAISIGCTQVTRMNNIINVKVAAVSAGSIRMPKGFDTLSELPVVKGQVGEDYIESILRERFGDVANVAKNPKSGDLSLFLEHRKLTIEVKNYSNPVPAGTVDKFRRDLTTSGALGGIFISLKTPIANVTSDFAIRYEYADCNTVPCAYIVSSDRSYIIVAINMILQLMTSYAYIAAEVHARDKIVAGVYEIGDRLDELAKSRSGIQSDINDIGNRLIKSATQLTFVEAGIRKALDDMRGDLFHIVEPNVKQAIVQMTSIPNYCKLDDGKKAFVSRVMQCVQTTLHRDDMNGSVWKLSAKKCANVISGISLMFSAKIVQVCIPRTRVQPDILVESLTVFAKKISIDDTINIELDVTTIEWICNIITNAGIVCQLPADVIPPAVNNTKLPVNSLAE
jgi:hypothetical protein